MVQDAGRVNGGTELDLGATGVRFRIAVWLSVASVSVGLVAILVTARGVWKARTISFSSIDEEGRYHPMVHPQDLEYLTQRQGDVTRMAAAWVLAGAGLQFLAGLLGLWAVLAKA
jgi:hypothetical protein